MTKTNDEDSLNSTSAFMNNWDAIVQSVRIKEEKMSHMSQMLCAGQSDREDVPFFTDF